MSKKVYLKIVFGFVACLIGVVTSFSIPPILLAKQEHQSDSVYILGDLVWQDSDQDGYQDPNERGYPNIKVALYNDGLCSTTIIADTETDEAGQYNFTDLLPGNYCLKFSNIPVSQMVSPPQNRQGDQSPNDTLDSDGVASADRTIAYIPNINLNTDDLTRDLGLYLQTTEIGDRVWLDSDGDGYQDSDEPGVPDISVHLLTEDGKLYQTQITDESGYYLFEGILSGSYIVQFDLATVPPGYIVTTPNAPAISHSGETTEGDQATDSDASPENGATGLIDFLLHGSQEHDIDMGIYKSVEISGRAWLDENSNGLRDETESGVKDVAVTLFDSADNSVAQTQTENNGSYTFEDLPPGAYYVVFDLNTLTENYVVTIPNLANNDEIDSDVNPSTGKSSIIELVADTQNVDMGLYTLSGVRVGGTVWLDTNANGIQDVAEVGVPDVGVTLFNSADQPIAQTTSKANGIYLFDGLKPGSYYVIFELETLPAKHYVTRPEVNDDDQNHSDADVDSGKTSSTPFLADGVETLSLNMGIYAYASIGDRVWADANADGIQDESELGIAGVAVYLLDETGQATGKTAITDADGQFSFTEIWPGHYQLEFVAGSEYTISPQNQGDSDAADSDVQPQNRRTAVTNLISGENDPIWDLGLYQSTTVGDRIWLDADGNGIQNNGESGLAQVTIHLLDNTGNILASTKSDEQGNYLFQNLPPGEYQLYCEPPEGLTYTRMRQSALGLEHPDDSDVDPISGRTALFALAPNTEERSWDIGLTEPAEIRSLVWVDLDGNGIKDAIEAGIANMVVNLYNLTEELVHTTNTDVAGAYQFTNLTPGGYIVEFLPPSGFTLTSQEGPNGSGNISSGASPLTGRTQIVTLLPSELETNLAAGIIEDNNNHGPTSVELETFTVSIVEREIIVEWQTTAENDTLGFYLYRSTTGERNMAVQLNAEMVISQSAEGELYQYNDNAILGGVTYTYWLQEVEQDGRIRDYGPVEVEAEQESLSVWYTLFLPLYYMSQNN